LRVTGSFLALGAPSAAAHHPGSAIRAENLGDARALEGLVEAAVLFLTTRRRLGPSAAGVRERGGGRCCPTRGGKRAAEGAGGGCAPEMEAAVL